ncbi:MAG: hypothetical protein JWO38_6792 [Gemmataceae bacterium]|nr:hypothetical protein [Gemmataceae bacterium]
MHEFELTDLIRVNQLVRGRIDVESFRGWFTALPPEHRRALTYLLCEFAHQAGVTEAIRDEALAASGLSPTDQVVQQVWSVRRAEFPVFPLYTFVVAVSEAALPTVFRLFVYLFGVAEGRVYRGESREHCNHWWHRDLLDERVVRDLLSNPRFYMTARTDDARIKSPAEPGAAR